ncbi:MAG: hypothetical protein MUO67_02180 [Anaerolineales bacterium]|nr:hypothetical protein [Anaerolineales bacterium]
MKISRKIFLLSLIMFTSMIILAAAPSSTELARLEIKNKTHLPVHIAMRKASLFYYLTVEPYQTTVFTVERETYLHTTWVCEQETTGTLEVENNLRLVFTSCYYKASPNAGTPTMEKIHLNDSPTGIMWRYQNFNALPSFRFFSFF